MKRYLHYTIPQHATPVTIDAFVRSHGFTSSIIKNLKQTNNGVMVNQTWKHFWELLNPGDHLIITIDDQKISENIVPSNLPLTIHYEDEDILVINKDWDCPIHPSQNNYSNTLANAVQYYYQQQEEAFTFRCINRLDRDTTGLTVIAKHYFSAAKLSLSMKNRLIKRTYLALVEGITPLSGTIDLPVGRVEGSTIERCIDFAAGEQAITHYQRLAIKNGHSLISLNLETGRTHQIRVHMKAIGHPLLGDGIYNQEDQSLPRQALHSYQLTFPHPVTGILCQFMQPLPIDMEGLL